MQLYGKDEQFMFSLFMHCPGEGCRSNWGLFPPARINDRLAGDDRYIPNPSIVRCIECKRVYKLELRVEKIG